MTTVLTPPREASCAGRVVPATGTAYRLSAALAVVAAAAAGTTVALPEVLSGPAAMNGSAIGTALVVLLVAVPVLLAGMRLAARGSVPGLFAWLAAVAYLAYNAVLFVFATPLNELFLLYVAMLALSGWALVSLLLRVDLAELGSRATARLPARGLAVYAWVAVVLTASAWLRGLVPATLRGEPGAVLEGTGLTTNPVYVLDLGGWLPVLAVGAWWLWQRRARGVLVVGALLGMLVVESLGIAVDQWFGSQADPSSPVVSAAVVPVFAALALVTLVPLLLMFRGLQGSRRSSGPRTRSHRYP
jgi:hypothetical protein